MILWINERHIINIYLIIPPPPPNIHTQEAGFWDFWYYGGGVQSSPKHMSQLISKIHVAIPPSSEHHFWSTHPIVLHIHISMGCKPQKFFPYLQLNITPLAGQKKLGKQPLSVVWFQLKCSLGVGLSIGVGARLGLSNALQDEHAPKGCFPFTNGCSPELFKMAQGGGSGKAWEEGRRAPEGAVH